MRSLLLRLQGYVLRLRPLRGPSYSIDIQGRTYVLPPLAVGTLRDLTRDSTLARLIGTASGEPGKVVEGLEAMVRVISTALRTRYPHCTEEWVNANVPAGQHFAALSDKVLRGSGLFPVEGDGGGNAASPGTV